MQKNDFCLLKINRPSIKIPVRTLNTFCAPISINVPEHKILFVKKNVITFDQSDRALFRGCTRVSSTFFFI